MSQVVEIHAPIGRKRLRTAVDVRDEVERVYKAMARDHIPLDKGSRLINALMVLIKAHEISVIEPALEAAERVQRESGR